MSQSRYTSRGISNGGKPQLSRRRVAATSPAPNAAPWAAAVPCFAGAPNPMTVRQQIRVGRPSSSTAAARASRTLVGVVAVDVPQDAPPVSFETGRDVFGVPVPRLAVDGDAVVVVKAGELAESQSAGEGGGFVRHPLHHAAVAREHPGAVVHHGEALAC